MGGEAGVLAAYAGAGGSVDVLLHLRRLLPVDTAAFIAFRSGNTAYFEWLDTTTRLPGLGRLLRYGGIVGLCSSWAHMLSSFFLKDGWFARLFACSLYRLGREALVTGNPPQPSRRLGEAILYAYIARLLRDGASCERVAAKLASTARGGGSLLACLILRGQQHSASIYAAVHGSNRLCILHKGNEAGIAVGRWEPEGMRCYTGVVAVAGFSGRGAVRVEVKPLERVLYG